MTVGAGGQAGVARRPIRVGVTGARGFVGTAVVTALRRRGDAVVRLVRRDPQAADEASWSPVLGIETPRRLGRLDAVVHLAGESLDSGRWTAARKRRIRDSRVLATERLAGSLARLDPPPGVLVAASAVGIYGNRASERLTEASELGTGFLARLARDWEAATEPARERGVRVVSTRFGLVLSPEGGVLARMLPLFRLGLGGPVGERRAWWSWIALEDAAALVLHALDRPDLQGPVNAVAPEPTTSAGFAHTLATVLRRPALLPVPPTALRIVFGEMADEMLLASLRVEPARALASGFTFRHPRLGEALRRILGRRAAA